MPSSSAARPRRAFSRPRRAGLTIVATLCAALVVAACDGGSGGDATSSPATPVTPTSSSPSSSSSSSSAPVARPGVSVGSNPSTRLKVDTWGATSDGLLSVVVSNVGSATVRSAHAIISAEDAYGNVVAAVSAPQGTPLGTRCCTIIGLAPGHRYGLYSNIGTRVGRVKSVSVQYTSVRTDAKAVPSPVLSIQHASLRRTADQADVSVTVTMAKGIGPYITVQALLNGPDKKFLAVISGGFYCLEPATRRTIKLQFFHPVPAGSSVESVVSFPLDAATARIEKLKRCDSS